MTVQKTAQETVQNKGLPRVVVCQNTTCKQQGSQKVLAAFERCVPDGVPVEISGCLGQCGNGPMVIVLTEGVAGEEKKPHKTWYSAVSPADAFAIASRYFKKDKLPPIHKQSVQIQKQQSFFWIWLVGLILFFSMCGLLALVLGGPSHYG